MDDKEQRQKLFEEQKAELLKRELSNAENFDKAVLAYSSAGLAFSVGFLKDFLPITKAQAGYLLYASWALFTLTIILTIVSWLTSQRGISEQLKINERYYLQRDESAYQANHGNNLFARATVRLNEFSGLCFILAVVFTTIFVSLNLERAAHDDRRKETPSAYSTQTPAGILPGRSADSHNSKASPAAAKTGGPQQ